MLTLSGREGSQGPEALSLPDIDLVPLSTKLFPASVVQAFALPSVGGVAEASATAPQQIPNNKPIEMTQRAPVQINTLPIGHQQQQQAIFQQQQFQQHQQAIQHHQQAIQQQVMQQQQCHSVGSPKPHPYHPPSNYPMYVPYPQGMPPPYASALPGDFGNLGYNIGPLHHGGYTTYSISDGQPNSSGHKPQGVRFMAGSAPSMQTETTEEDPGDGTARAVKRARLVWTPLLHKRFEEAVAKLGPEKSIPKNIMQEMNVEGLTRENVASHLQKFRLQKSFKDESPHQGPEESVQKPTEDKAEKERVTATE